MLSQRLVTELKSIAFNIDEKARNVVSACASLARNGIELTEIKSVLECIATNADIPADVRVKAIDLIDKITTQEEKDKESGKSDDVKISETDAKRIEQELLKQYGL